MAEDVVVEGELERVPVVALRRYGRRLSVVLARPRQKRCDFQIVDKAYKHPESRYRLPAGDDPHPQRPASEPCPSTGSLSSPV